MKPKIEIIGWCKISTFQERHMLWYYYLYIFPIRTLTESTRIGHCIFVPCIDPLAFHVYTTIDREIFVVYC